MTDHNTIDGALRLREMDVPFRVVVGEEIYTLDGEIIGSSSSRPSRRTSPGARRSTGSTRRAASCTYRIPSAGTGSAT